MRTREVAKVSITAKTAGAYAKTVIFDECQELRRRGSEKYNSARHLAGRMTFRLGLSATPIYNYGGEIWNVLDVICPGQLGDHSEFAREWCVDSGRHQSVREPKALGSYLREHFLMLRRTKKEVGRELPPVEKIVHTVDTDTAALDRIKDSAAELARLILAETPLDGSKAFAVGEQWRASEELSWMLRQATGVGKAPYVGDFVRMLVESGEKVVVFCWHREVYAILNEKLKDYEPVMFTGSETPKQKDEAKQAFLEGKTPVLLMSLRAAAGLDGLQNVCRVGVFAELDWTPGIHEQAIGRISRDGQPDPVTIYTLVSETGSDPVVAETLGLKREQIEGIRNPKRDLIEALQTNEGRAKRLAEHYLSTLKHKKAGGGHAQADTKQEAPEEPQPQPQPAASAAPEAST